MEMDKLSDLFRPGFYMILKEIISSFLAYFKYDCKYNIYF